MPQKNEEGLLNESFDENEFKDKDVILQEISNFWTLSSSYQRKMVKNLPLILDKITH